MYANLVPFKLFSPMIGYIVSMFIVVYNCICAATNVDIVCNCKKKSC